MKILDAIKQKTPIVIDLGDHERLIAELIKHPQGWVFVDIWWTDPLNSTHPFHLVEAEITGDGPWRLGPYEITEINAGHHLYSDWKSWVAASRKVDSSRERAAMSASASLDFDITE
jgi:hypothetical protein